MKNVALGCLLLAATSALAQGAVVGSYTGSYTLTGNQGNQEIGTKLVISGADKGAVKGTVALSSGRCAGEYPMEGKLADGKLSMHSTAKSGRAGDCDFSFKVTQDGDKLVGTTGGGRPLKLSK